VLEYWGNGQQDRRSDSLSSGSITPPLNYSRTPGVNSRPELFSITGMGFIQGKVKPQMEGWDTSYSRDGEIQRVICDDCVFYI
jgi:hypothetical protein